LPRYLERAHDKELRGRIRGAVVGASTLVVLVGGSSTGKTRACWEAIKDEKLMPPQWRLWHPLDPTRTEAVLDKLDRVLPCTVIWLNNAQHYLLTHGSDRGERVAARLRTLLADPDRSPVLLLATMWPEDWVTLMQPPKSGKQDPHEQTRELLDGHNIKVPKSFSNQVVSRLQADPGTDPRLVEAANKAQNGELIQYLAGAPELMDRYQNAPDGAWALVTAAMDISRLGHGPAIPKDLLRAATPAYLTNPVWDKIGHNKQWFKKALAYARKRGRGDYCILGRIRARPGEPGYELVSYRLADYLDEAGQQIRRREIIPSGLWSALITHVQESASAAAIGQSAADRMLYSIAIPLLRRAAAGDDWSAADRLVKLLAEGGDVDGLAQLSEAGDTYAAHRLARLIDERNDAEGLRQLAEAGNESAAFYLTNLLANGGDVEGLRRMEEEGNEYARHRLIDVLAKQGDADGLAQFANREETLAGVRLAEVLAKQGDVDGLRRLAKAGNKDADYCLAELLGKQGDLDHLRRLVDSGDGYLVPRATIALADLLFEQGDVDGLRQLEVGEEGYSSAGDRLVKLLTERGDIEGLRRLVDKGEWRAAHPLAELLAQQGDFGYWRQLADNGDSMAAYRLAQLLAERNDLEAFRHWADDENSSASYYLAELLAERGQIEEALEMFRRLADIGSSAATHRLVELLTERDQIDEAVAVLRRLHDDGNRKAGDLLPQLLATLGDVEGLRRLHDDGDWRGARALADLFAEQRNLDALKFEVLRGNVLAQERLIDLVASDDPTARERLRRSGINPDGTVK
jgi:hypothetical protein